MMENDIIVTPLSKINTTGGDVFHAMKQSEKGYRGFGEAYFSTIEQKAIKAWKRHRLMTCNLIVPNGSVRFVLFDDRGAEKEPGDFQEIILSKDNYCRLTIPPMVWFGFQGAGNGLNLVLNIADIEHDPEEADQKPIYEIEYEW